MKNTIKFEDNFSNVPEVKSTKTKKQILKEIKDRTENNRSYQKSALDFMNSKRA